MRKVLVLFAVSALLSTAAFGCTYFMGRSATQSLDDTVIAGDIKTKIVKDPDLNIFAIDVSSYEGNVTLAGVVPDKAAQQRVIRYAQNTQGVKSVKTNLKIAGAAPATNKQPLILP